MDSYRSDVIVVGGGIAGICTALELLERGRSVTLLERDEEANFGGLAKESFGGIFVVGSPEQARAGFSDSPDLAFADWCRFGELGEGELWPRRWAEAYVNRSLPDVYRWLRANGIKFFPIPHWIERGLALRGNSVPRFHIVWGTGQELALRLAARLRGHAQREKLTLRFGHRVEALTTKNGAAAGCRGVLEAGGAAFEAEADCVVLAAGGINGNLELVRRHWHRDWGSPPETILNGSHRYADGRLHEAARALGARVTHLDKMWNYAAGVHHFRPRKPDHGLSLVPPPSALWLNFRGERIRPPLVTGYDTRDLVTQVCRQERQYSWQVLNRKIALKELAVSGAEFNPSIRDRKMLAFLRDTLFGNRWLYDELTRNCADIVLAGTPAELAAKMNRLQGDTAVDAALLERELRAYDDAVRRGAIAEDQQVARIVELRKYRGNKVRTCNLQPILEPKAGPLVAMREFIVSRKSLGGLQTDLASRVLQASGQPLPGLYAAGESAGFGGGGMHGLRALEGGFLGGCILSGRIAGRAIGGEATP
jgi:predicted oxidoreductase